MKIGRPVKWVETRSEDLASSVHGRGSIHRVNVSFTYDGRVLSLDDDVILDLGAYPALPYRGYSAYHIFDSIVGPYDIRSLSFRLRLVCTNKAPYGHYRGPGMLEGIFVVERVMDRVARYLGMDPVELRRRNLPKKFPHTTPTGVVLDPGSYRKSLEEAVKTSDYESVRDLKIRSGKDNLLGVGVALCAEITGLATADMGRRYAYPSYEYSQVQVDLDGKTTLMTGLCPHGQLNETTMAQVVAKELGVKYDDVEVRYGDTDLVSYGGGTGGGSRAAVIGGGSAMVASGKLREKILRISAHVLRVPKSDLTLKDGLVSSTGGASVSLADIARVAILEPDKLPPGESPLLVETTVYQPKLGYTFGNACHVALVRVDRMSGKVDVLKYFVVEDCGEMINEEVIMGQTMGGIIQGLGEALYEEMVYDGACNPLTTTFMDYCIPSTVESPPIEIRHLTTPSENTGGFKGVGEGGIVGALPAVVNAVEDALNSAGIRAELDSIPLTTERVFAAINSASQK